MKEYYIIETIPFNFNVSQNRFNSIKETVSYAKRNKLHGMIIFVTEFADDVIDKFVRKV